MDTPVGPAAVVAMLLVGCGPGADLEPVPASTGSVTVPDGTIEPAPSPSGAPSPRLEPPITDPAF